MTKDAENNVSIMENGYIGCSHHRPANKDNPSQTEVDSKTLYLMVSHPYERTVRWLEGRPQLKWMEKAVHQLVQKLWMGS